MFGSANILSVILEVKNGDIYNPDDAAEARPHHQVRRRPEGRRAVPDPLDRPPEGEEHHRRAPARCRSARSSIPRCRRRRRTPIASSSRSTPPRACAASSPSLDDTAAVVHAGFWEEALDFRYLHERLTRAQGAGGRRQPHHLHHRLPVAVHVGAAVHARRSCTSSSLHRASRSRSCSTSTSAPGPASGCRSSPASCRASGVSAWPSSSASTSTRWCWSSRSSSPRARSATRCSRWTATTRSTTACTTSTGDRRARTRTSSRRRSPRIVTDGIGLLVVAVAPIPLIQKVAIFASFWIISIFISVVTLHPIILSYIDPPPQTHELVQGHQRSRSGSAGSCSPLFCVAGLGLHYAGYRQRRWSAC